MDSGRKKKFFYQILLKERGKYGMMVSKNSRAEGQRVARLVKSELIQNCHYGTVHGCLTLGSESVKDRIGNEVWSYYGHSALRIQDKMHGSDVAVNWGMFSFNVRPSHPLPCASPR